MGGYFYILFIDFMLKGKSLLRHTNLFIYLFIYLLFIYLFIYLFILYINYIIHCKVKRDNHQAPKIAGVHGNKKYPKKIRIKIYK